MLKDKYVMFKGELVEYKDLKRNSMIPLTVICDSCGKEFTSTKYQLERNGHQKCQACALLEKQRKYLTIGDKYGRLTVIGHSERPGYSICECECGNIKEYFNYYLKSGETKSCGCLLKDKSRKHFEELSKIQVGENHPNWKGGVTDLRHKLEGSKEYKTIKEYNKTLFRCIHCGTTEDIKTHHIVSFSVDPSKFSDPKNAVPICEKCLKEYYNIYGFSGGEKEFNEYLNTPFDPLI